MKILIYNLHVLEHKVMMLHSEGTIEQPDCDDSQLCSLDSFKLSYGYLTLTKSAQYRSRMKVVKRQ